MRLTIDIDVKDISALQRITGVKKKSPAVGKAISMFLHEMRKKRILRKVMQGKTDYRLSNDDLEELGKHDPC